jgi:hypothetical protein
VILGLVVAGSAWVRFRPSSSSGTATGPVTPAAQGESVQDVTARDASVVSGDLRITLSVSPRPPVAFSDMRVRVRAEAVGDAGAALAPVPLDHATVTFEMSMPMGDHHYTLVPGKDGWLEAAVVLPFCGSGDPRWTATVEGTVAGARRAARFRLDLQRPKD